MAASTFDNRCRFAVELESLGVLCLLPAKATQVDNKEMLLYIFLYEKIRAFSGGEILEPKTNSRCWRDLFSSRKLLAKKLASNMLLGLKIIFSPSKKRGCCGGRWGRLKRPVGLGQQFFSRHKNYPLKTETRRRAWAPQRSPLKSECLGVTILPVWPENEKIFSSYRLMKMRPTRQNRAKVSKVET